MTESSRGLELGRWLVLVAGAWKVTRARKVAGARKVVGENCN